MFIIQLHYVDANAVSNKKIYTFHDSSEKTSEGKRQWNNGDKRDILTQNKLIEVRHKFKKIVKSSMAGDIVTRGIK